MDSHDFFLPDGGVAQLSLPRYPVGWRIRWCPQSNRVTALIRYNGRKLGEVRSFMLFRPSSFVLQVGDNLRDWMFDTDLRLRAAR